MMKPAATKACNRLPSHATSSKLHKSRESDTVVTLLWDRVVGAEVYIHDTTKESNFEGLNNNYANATNRANVLQRHRSLDDGQDG